MRALFADLSSTSRGSRYALVARSSLLDGPESAPFQRRGTLMGCPDQGRATGRYSSTSTRTLRRNASATGRCRRRWLPGRARRRRVWLGSSRFPRPRPVEKNCRQRARECEQRHVRAVQAGPGSPPFCDITAVRTTRPTVARVPRREATGAAAPPSAGAGGAASPGTRLLSVNASHGQRVPRWPAHRNTPQSIARSRRPATGLRGARGYGRRPRDRRGAGQRLRITDITLVER